MYDLLQNPGILFSGLIGVFIGYVIGVKALMEGLDSGTKITEYHDLVTDTWNVDVKVYDKKGELIASGEWKGISRVERDHLIQKYKK